MLIVGRFSYSSSVSNNRMSPLSVFCCFTITIQLVSSAAVSSDIQPVARSADVKDELTQLRNRVAALEAKAKRVCPGDFIYVPSINGCYKVQLKNLDWVNAAFGCRELHKDAHLVIIDNAAEQHGIVNMMAHHHNDYTLRTCATPPNWSGLPFWTAGQRVDPSHNTPFVWKVISADGMKTIVSHMSYALFNGGQPDFAKSAESCLNLIRSWGYRWNDGPCPHQICSLCEIDLM